MSGWRRRKPDEDLETYFWEQVLVGEVSQCWPWTRSKRNGMHGSISVNDKKVWAHRLAYEFSTGPIPDGMVVRHSCDNPPCCNPFHLLLGTQADNMKDAVARGRSARGERNGRSKLKGEQVMKIRQMLRDGSSQSSIAEAFGVSRGAIKHIANGTTWPEAGDES